ncbi:hypothetical protein BASA50_007295 [Batrachochytrium salamandrivorans]|uniref:Uncharacterized protein n=1 Tax=Batrachochytrium salamandrivorans TaxID=1357716 RepID=A0ABQ8F7C6_9FUNG|nr:hypothetical protein BASA50_007295 [Batrachochytrium salamandrivorans]
MTSNTFNFNATFCFSLNRTVTPVARGSPSGGSSAANIRLDGQFQFSASIRVDMDGPSAVLGNPEALEQAGDSACSSSRSTLTQSPRNWVTTYIDNEPRTFYYPMKQH